MKIQTSFGCVTSGFQLSRLCFGADCDVHTEVTYWGLGRGNPLVHELAWGYDLVLTTFTRLSADWSQRLSSSPLKQVWAQQPDPA